MKNTKSKKMTMGEVYDLCLKEMVDQDQPEPQELQKVTIYRIVELSRNVNENFLNKDLVGFIPKQSKVNLNYTYPTTLRKDHLNLPLKA